MTDKERNHKHQVQYRKKNPEKYNTYMRNYMRKVRGSKVFSDKRVRNEMAKIPKDECLPMTVEQRVIRDKIVKELTDQLNDFPEVEQIITRLCA